VTGARVASDQSSEAAIDDTGARIRVDLAALRQLIVEAAPDPALAEPVLRCDPDTVLDTLIPFSSVIVLGVIVAVEDAYAIQVTKSMIVQALDGGATLHKLAQMIEAAR
jgi:hypothetical protein